MPSITYNLNIPDGPNNPSVDQPNMKINTNSVSTWCDTDHYTFAESNAGWHRKSTYVAQGSNPGSASGQLVEFSKTSSGSTELFFQRDNVATAIQLTRGGISTSTNGYSFLPGGVLIQWGQINFAAATAAVSFATSFTSAPLGLAFMVNTTAPGTNGVVGYNSLTSSGFTAYQQGSGALTVKYIAVGV